MSKECTTCVAHPGRLFCSLNIGIAGINQAVDAGTIPHKNKSLELRKFRAYQASRGCVNAVPKRPPSQV